MFRILILERPGADLYSNLIAAMRSNDLRIFVCEKWGHKILH